LNYSKARVPWAIRAIRLKVCKMGETETKKISELIDEYIESINAADPALGARVWATTPDVSFIHPRGTERGWDEVVANFYGTTMGASFTKRTLRRVGDIGVSLYGDAAVARFEWDFVALRRDTGERLHTTGRETQVFVRVIEKGWRLVHVHYSGPPVTAAGQGF